MSKKALSIRGLGKRYMIGEAAQRHDSFRDLLVDKLKSVGKKKPKSEFWALNNASFDIEHGENVGIIGMNGAGKSTLLKILSRITEPSAGTALIDGRVGALLEVGTGFHAELTGRENVFLYGSILGMHKEEIERKFDAIVEFSEIAKFIDTPVKRYSSGMYVRLAFSVAANLEPDILLLDEVLAVGDLAFQRKCIDHAKELQKRDATILFVSHNMFSIKTMCDRVLYLRKGEIQYDGTVEGGIELYEKDCRMTELSWTKTKPEEWPIYITGCELLDERGTPKTMFDFGERMSIKLHYATREAVVNPNFIVAFIRSDGTAVCNFNPESDGVTMGRVDEPGTLTLHLPPLKLVAEMYTIWIIIREPGFAKILSGQIATTFHVRHPLFDTHFGTFHESAVKWEFSEAEPAGRIANGQR
jgi:lipopolysaccharide transport system ATP-binding protein